MKNVIFFFITLVCLIGGLLLYQWVGYSTHKEEAVQNIQQTIQIKHTKDRFQIEQTITGIEGKKYTIKVPKGTRDIYCINNDKNECNVSAANKIVLDAGYVTFSYEMSISQDAKSLLLENYSFKLQDIEIASTKVQISDSIWRKGNWISSSENTNMRKMDLVDYYVIENKGTEPLLYWQTEPLSRIEVNKKLIIYANSKIDYDLLKNEEKLPIQNEGEVIHIVLSNIHEEVEKDNFLILSAKKQQHEVRERFTNAFIHSFFKNSSDFALVTDLISSIILNKAIGDSKSRKMYEELTDKITSEQLNSWKDKVFNLPSHKISQNKLDKLLEEVTGFKSSFFTENASNEETVIPLSFFDKRELNIMDKKIEDVKIIHEKGKIMIEFVPLLKELQFDVMEEDNDVFRAEKGAIKYRFYPNKRIFELNEQKYGMSHAPVVDIGGHSFIPINLVNTLLNVKITESETKIEIR
ncbi:stalk domain-containing protein [Lederbergia wuyishanensis]|uniref:Copper amine oxidase-like N-terminal domain-containing protein n=1 Tax=Lederbergia wuyishanensis TaxID=1347903 RepID=A0ABU0CZF5_9BACI|nr:stalk domain-containing protein [Lederbergia wuyishanensis]MCJ8006154.1 hypothetical protein [Lederbergia wuyishanensis]MDQ0341523.1 hypothetical protein [Lederbergia wuyishanensis]